MNELERVINLKKAYRKPAPKKLIKRGTIAHGIVETTPIVWNGRLLYFGWKRTYEWDNDTLLSIKGCYQFVDIETNEEVASFAEGHSFGSAYAENGKMYVIGTEGGFGSNKLVLFVSDDLKNWEKYTVFEKDSWVIYNTSICKGKDGYILAIEIGEPSEIVGVPYTIVFAKSDDMIQWEMLDVDKYVYRKDRYAACPVIRFVDGYYYMIYLEAFSGYNSAPYIVRTKDLLDWELAPINPIMWYDDSDRKVEHPEYFSKKELEDIQLSLNTNNSDVDICEWQGKTIILYSWGNQCGREFLALAEYEGSMKEFFESFY